MRFILAVIVAALAFGCTSSEPEIPKSSAFVNINIIDGLGNPPIKGFALVIEDSVISAIIPQSEIDSKLYTLIDCKGAYVLPGFIDTHVHATVLQYDVVKGHQDVYDSLASVESLRSMMDFGVVAVRNVAGPTEAAIELRTICSDNNELPKMITSGYALNKSNYPPFRKMSSKQDIAVEIESQKSLGVDIIKVYASLEPELTWYAIEEAHRNGLKVVGHLQRTTWTEAANFGIDFITHAAPWSHSYLKDSKRYSPTMLGRLDWIEQVDYTGASINEMITAMKSNQVMFDPTLIAFHTKFWAQDSSYTNRTAFSSLAPTIQTMWQNASFVDGWSASDFERAQSLWPKLTNLTLKIYEAGIPLTIGTDFPNPWIYPGASFHEEMELLNKAGIPELQVIRAATSNGALALGMEKTHGTVEVGKIADLIFVEGNPAEDIRNTRKISMILRKGKVLNTELK